VIVELAGVSVAQLQDVWENPMKVTEDAQSNTTLLYLYLNHSFPSVIPMLWGKFYATGDIAFIQQLVDRVLYRK
jgi:hypothetical protein